MVKKMNLKLNNGDDVVVQIDGDGAIHISGIGHSAEEALDSLHVPRCIWKQYVDYRHGDSVVRSGSGLCGVFPYDPSNPTNERYVETDTMHSTTVEELAWDTFRYYPLLFDLRQQVRIAMLLRYHDLGENRDCPDDGSRPHDQKFEEELANFIGRIRSLPRMMQENLIQDFIVFENADSLFFNNETRRLMQFAKLCDKTDAPLGALLYEMQGRKGSLEYKRDHFGGITEQDQKFADEIGEYSQAGIWTAHLLDTYNNYDYIDIFVEIIAVACQEVRGKCFPWMCEFLERRHFDNILITKIESIS